MATAKVAVATAAAILLPGQQHLDGAGRLMQASQEDSAVGALHVVAGGGQLGRWLAGWAGALMSQASHNLASKT